jgi:hypothetical protein
MDQRRAAGQGREDRRSSASSVLASDATGGGVTVTRDP